MCCSWVSRKFATAHHTRVSIKREDLLAGVSVGALRDGEVRHSRVKRREDLAIVQVVFGGADRRRPAFALRRQRIEGEHAVLRLAKLGMALLNDRLRLLVLRQRGLHLGLGEQDLSALLLNGLLLSP